jgi:hypothetical protein
MVEPCVGSAVAAAAAGEGDSFCRYRTDPLVVGGPNGCTVGGTADV